MKWLFWIFTALYALALLALGAGTYGWLGTEQDPLSGVFLLPLGLPWNILADKAGLEGTGVMIAAPGITAAILYWLWKR
tara:strand:+ start:295 stop:531 length:237 start_codon:yes stop_codon:yes gene_type:complete